MRNWNSYNLEPHALMPGATVSTAGLVAKIVQSAADPRRTLETLTRIVSNVLQNPGQAKFAELSKTSVTVRQVIGQSEPCSMLLRRCGFREGGDRFHLQPTGLRFGEVGRLIISLSAYSQYQDLTLKLASAAGFPVRTNAASPNIMSVGRTMQRRGWTEYAAADADAGDDAHQVSAHDLQACMLIAEQSAFGGFSVWNGTAFFREPTGEELKTRLVQADPSVTFYIYERPDDLGDAASQSSHAAAEQPSDQAAQELDDDEDLKEAMRLSMILS